MLPLMRLMLVLGWLSFSMGVLPSGFLSHRVLRADEPVSNEPKADTTDTPVQTSESFVGQTDSPLHYLLALPGDYESDSSQRWPLILFLHGAGERGDDLQLVKKHGPPKLLESGKSFPAIVVSPQCPKNQRWETESLIGLMDDLESKYRIDSKRIYVTGLSMGGYGSWAMAAAIPDRLAAVAPICGGGDPSQAEAIAKVPVWAFHGAKDDVVPITKSEIMVAAVKEAGGQIKLTTYPEAQHDSWTETYNNDSFYEWILEQERK